MDTKSLKETIKSYAASIGIDKIGFTTSEPFDDLKEALYNQKEKGFTTGFEHPNIEERVYPDLIFDQPKSIISIGLAYPSRIKTRKDPDLKDKRGQFCRASWGKDYHFILKDKLQQLSEYIIDLVPQAKTKYMVDTGALMDVVVAQRAGLGFIGRNGLLITKEFGSWLYLGEMITNIEFEPDQPVTYNCGDCYRCVQACPTQALFGDGSIHGKRCLSYQTQTKTIMPEEFRRKITSVIYGCDICQLVCPYNQGIDFHLHSEMEAQIDETHPRLKTLLKISNKEFQNKHGHLAGSWRGKKPIQRNAIIALANMLDQTAIPHLIELMEEDVRPDIRAISAWALSQIQKFHNQSLIDCMQDQMTKETDEQVIQEFKQAISKLQSKRPARN